MIVAGTGSDILVGGAGRDTIDAGHGDNIVFGDHGKVKRYGDHIVRIQTVDSNRGAADILRTGNGKDIIFGGARKDSIHAGGGHDIVFGGNGKLILITWSKHEWEHEHGSEHGDDDRKAKHRANDERWDTPEIDWTGRSSRQAPARRSPGRATLPRTG